MHRRRALQLMMGSLGLTSFNQVFGSAAFLSAVSATQAAPPVLSDDDQKLLDQIGEVIIPTTEDSPGAKAAGIGAFMQAIVCDYYNLEEQKIFLLGLTQFRSFTLESKGSPFPELNDEQKVDTLFELERRGTENRYYQMIKQLTVWGYFSSEIGTKKALRFNPIPGRYDGSVEIEPGTKAWANLIS